MMDENRIYRSSMALAAAFFLAMGCGGDDIGKKGAEQQQPEMAEDAGADLEPGDTGGGLDASMSDTGNPVSDASNSGDQGSEADGAMVDMSDNQPDMAEDTGPMVCDLAFESTLRPALHIIADYSASMIQTFTVGGPHLYQVQNSSLMALAARITSQFRVGFVSFPHTSTNFNTCAPSVQEWVPMGEWSETAIISNLQSSPNGNSASAAALREVEDSMRFSNPNDPDADMRERHVLIFADSEGNVCLDDGDDVASAQQMSTATGATLHAIALDPGSDLFPEQAALQTGGTHSIVGRVDEMTPAIEAALDAMDACTLTLTSAPTDPSTFKLFDAGVEVDASDYVLNGLDLTLSDGACSTVSFEDLTATSSC